MNLEALYGSACASCLALLAAYMDIEADFRKKKLGLVGLMSHVPTIGFLGFNALLGVIGFCNINTPDYGPVWTRAVVVGLGVSVALRSKVFDYQGHPIGIAIMYDWVRYKVMFSLHVHSTALQRRLAREATEVLGGLDNGKSRLQGIVVRLWQGHHLDSGNSDSETLEEFSAEMNRVSEILSAEELVFWAMDQVGAQPVAHAVQAEGTEMYA